MKSRSRQLSQQAVAEQDSATIFEQQAFVLDLAGKIVAANTLKKWAAESRRHARDLFLKSKAFQLLEWPE